LLVLITLQAVLGIVTLLHVAPLGLALAHQGVAVIVLTAAVLHAENLRHREAADGLALPEGARS
jgi:cytochrome c oxidase assembly protein subunit 15